MIKKIFLTFVLCLWSFNVSAGLVAGLNREQVPQGEVVVLTLDYDGQNDGDPDFSALEKDFHIYSVGSSFRSNFINGKTSMSRQWTLILMPKEKGLVTVPPISLGGEVSKELKLEVTEAAPTVSHPQTEEAAKPHGNEPQYKLTGEIDTAKSYIGQQMIYRLTLYDNGGLRGSEPYIISGKDDWQVHSLGRPEVKNSTVNGKNIREIVFNYALFPQKSGQLSLPRFKFDGYYLTKSSRTPVDTFADMFGDDLVLTGFGLSDMFATRNPVVLVTKAETVDVLPIPESESKKWWLPAENVRINAVFDKQPSFFEVGEAVTRIITLQAEGVTETQLPEINFSSGKGVKQYPEKPQFFSRLENDKIISSAVFKIVYIPTESGRISLPGTEVEWFNIKSGRPETAVLPSVEIEVKGDMPQTLSKAEETQDFSKEEGEQPTKSAVASTKITVAAVVGAFLLGIGVCLLTILFLHRKQRPQQAFVPSGTAAEVMAAARHGDDKALRDSLLRWAAREYSPAEVANLQDVIALTGDPEFVKSLEDLNSRLYGSAEKTFEAKDFIRTFQKVKKNTTRSKEKKAILPDLYKN